MATILGSVDVGTLAIIPNDTWTTPYTLTLGDSGKSFINLGATSVSIVIPAESTANFPLGSVVTFVNAGTGSMSISILTDTLNLAGAGSTGSRTLAQWGTATLFKYASGKWIISGTNLT